MARRVNARAVAVEELRATGERRIPRDCGTGRYDQEAYVRR